LDAQAIAKMDVRIKKTFLKFWEFCKKSPILFKMATVNLLPVNTLEQAILPWEIPGLGAFFIFQLGLKNKFLRGVEIRFSIVDKS
jgi:hypothetical protein